MSEDKNNFLLKVLRVAVVSTPFLFALIYIPGFVFPGSFPRTIFFYIATYIIFALWLLYSYRQSSITIQKNWLTMAVLGYLAVLFISGLTGGNFEYAFFGTFGRMNGIVTMLCMSIWYLVASSVLQRKDWVYILRLLLFSGTILAIISFLGINGSDIEFFRFLDQGGSLFGNNTFSGIYYLFASFFGIILLIKDTSFKWRISYILAMLVIVANPDIFNFQIWQNPSLLKDIFSHPFSTLGTARASAITLGTGMIITILMYLVHRTHHISTKLKSILFGLIFLCILLISIGFVWSATAQKGPGYAFLTSQKDFPRPIVWGQAVEAFQNKPLLGYGPNGFERAFQDTLTSDIAFLKGRKWFDKVHNGFLEPLVETGAVGTLSVLAIFLATCWYSFRYYQRTKDFSVVVIVLLLVLHMVQIQTSFNTNTSYLMIYILLAYIAFLESSRAVYNLSFLARTTLLSIGFVFVVVLAIFTAIIPAKHNYSIPRALTSGNFEARMNLYQSLRSLYGYPADMVYSTVEEFSNAVFASPELLNDEKAMAGIAVEYNAVLDLYESHYKQYKNNLRYLNNYVQIIYITRLFNIDRMDRAAELIASAKTMSTEIPQVFWLASLHAKYTGDENLAFAEVDKALVLCEAARTKFSESQLGDFCSLSQVLKTFLEKTRGSTSKVYFHIEVI